MPQTALAVALGIIVIGLLPDREEAIYLIALGLGLFMGAMGPVGHDLDARNLGGGWEPRMDGVTEGRG